MIVDLIKYLFIIFVIGLIGIIDKNILKCKIFSGIIGRLY